MAQMSVPMMAWYWFSPSLAVAVCAALANAVGEELSAEVPAAGPLAQVAAKGGNVPDLRNRYLLGRLCHERILVLDEIGVDDLS